MKVVVVLLAALVAVTAGRLAKLHKVDEPVKDQYIVVMKKGKETDEIKKFILEDVTGTFNGTLIRHTYTAAINGFSAKLNQKAVEKLRSREEIRYIVQDGVVRTSSVASWGLDRVDQRNLPLDGNANFRAGDGTGVNAYVIDTGIYPDSLYFEGRATAAFDSTQDTVGYGIDCNGHGTHCAGTLGGATYGVAPGVKLFGVKVLNCGGSGAFSDVIAGCDYVTNNAELPAVASMSLGGGANQATDDAVQSMISRGIPVIVAAGNSNSNACYTSPARVEKAITVGATDDTDRRAAFSNYGSCVDVFAPGVDIPSAWIGGTEETKTISGTSMSCPHVAGAAAIALGRKPNSSPSKITKRMIKKSTKSIVSDPGQSSPNRLLYIP